MKAGAAPVGISWMWTLMFSYYEDRTPTHGYEATREAAPRELSFAPSFPVMHRTGRGISSASLSPSFRMSADESHAKLNSEVQDLETML